MAIENIVYHIPKEAYDYVKKDVDYIDNYLLEKLGDCVMRNLVAKGEIVVKLSELCKEEFTPTNSIHLKRQISWEPLVRCGECKHKIQALSTEKGATGCELISGTFYEDFFCKEGERGANDEDIDPYQGERDRDENGEIY